MVKRDCLFTNGQLQVPCRALNSLQDEKKRIETFMRRDRILYLRYEWWSFHVERNIFDRVRDGYFFGRNLVGVAQWPVIVQSLKNSKMSIVEELYAEVARMEAH